MTIPFDSLANRALVGNDAGWMLAFHTEENGEIVGDPLEIGSEDYYASITASLPSGLEGGVYTIAIESLLDKHYSKLKKAKIARLFLYWRDTNTSVAGYIRNLSGLTTLGAGVRSEQLDDFLVAELAIVAVKRKLGARRYEVEISARERVYDKLASTRNPTALAEKDTSAALDALFGAFGVAFSRYELHDLPKDVAPAFRAGVTGITLLTELADRLESATGNYGRGMLLIRDGVLHVGTRPVPIEGEEEPSTILTVGGGLIETTQLEPIVTDPNADPAKKPATRRQFQLTLKGRPDIKPGSVVAFDPAPGDDDDTSASPPFGSVVPSLGDLSPLNKIELYVQSVLHQLGRTSGFVTTVTGVTVDDDAWDHHTELAGAPVDDVTQRPADTPVTDAAHAVHETVRRIFGGRSDTDVGEVRAAATSSDESRASQTLRVWEGLVSDDGLPNAARRLGIARPPATPSAAMPYASPFAWGKCGLVLPRYPGTRVVVTHRDGRSDDAIDIGALWESATGPNSEPGDWWLILPVGFEAAKRESIADDVVPTAHTGKVTQDLIDAEGNRVIEVGELTIRVGRDALAAAGTRPSRPSDADGVRIEHTGGGSSIVMRADGRIEIKTSGKDITIDAGSGSINLKADSVDVAVSSAMNVR
jgi:hypothetical protein